MVREPSVPRRKEYGSVAVAETTYPPETPSFKDVPVVLPVEPELPADLITSASIEPQIPSIFSVITPSIVMLLIAEVFRCLSSELLFSIFPLFAFTPIKSGGLGFNEAQIGTHLSIRALMAVGVMFLFSPLHRLTGRESALRIYQVSMALWPICMAFYPLLSWMATHGEGTSWGVGGWGFHIAMGTFFFIWRYVLRRGMRPCKC